MSYSFPHLDSTSGNANRGGGGQPLIKSITRQNDVTNRLCLFLRFWTKMGFFPKVRKIRTCLACLWAPR